MRNSIYRTGYFFLSVLIALGMTPVIVDALGDRMYGLWIIIGAFMGYYGFLDFGISTAVSRFVSRALSKNDTDEINRVLSAAFFLFSGVTLIILALTAIAIQCSSLFFESLVEADSFNLAVTILGLQLALGFPLRTFSGVLTAFLRYDLHTFAVTVRLILGNGLIFWLLQNGHGIVAMAWSLFAANLLQYALFFLFARRVYPKLRLRRSWVDKNSIKSLANYSAKSFAVELAGILRHKIDVLVIAKFIGLSAVTPYAIGARLIEYFINLTGSLMGNISPLFSRYEGEDNHDKLRKTFLFLAPINVAIAVFIGASIVFYGEHFILWWMGPDYHVAYIVAAILAPPITLSLMQNISHNVLYGVSKHHITSIVGVAGGVLNLALSIALVGRFGIQGVAAATAIELVFFKILIEPVWIARSIGVPALVYYSTFFGALLKSLLPLLLFFLAAHSFLAANPIRLGVVFAMQCLVFAPVAWILILSQETRGRIRDALSPIPAAES